MQARKARESSHRLLHRLVWERARALASEFVPGGASWIGWREGRQAPGKGRPDQQTEPLDAHMQSDGTSARPLYKLHHCLVIAHVKWPCIVMWKVWWERGCNWDAGSDLAGTFFCSYKWQIPPGRFSPTLSPPLPPVHTKTEVGTDLRIYGSRVSSER